MQARPWRGAVRLALWLMLAAVVTASGGDGAPVAEGGRLLYRVRAGDTLAGIATTYLGGADAVPELLRFNNVVNPLEVRPGFVLGIPGRVRDDAHTAMQGADAAILEAVAQGADEFAKAEIATARRVASEAQSALTETSYEKAVLLGGVAAAYAEEAGRLAGARALKTLAATVTSVHGAAFLNLGDKDDWQPVQEGAEVPAAGTLRAEADARVELRLPDGSRIQVQGGSTLNLSELITDRRTGTLHMRLKLLMGELLGEIEKMPTVDSKIEIESGRPVTAIRGTTLRVARDEAVSRVMLLEGSAKTRGEGWEVAVPENEGLVAQKRKPRLEELLPAPKVVMPDGAYASATQVVTLAWEPVVRRGWFTSRRLPWQRRQAPTGVTYHLEVATDAAFNRPVLDTNTAATAVTTAVLAPGTYYWRLASVARSGLEGKPSAARTLAISRVLGVAIVPGLAPREHDGKRWVNPRDTFGVTAVGAETSAMRLEVALDDGAYAAYAGPVRLAEGGQRTIRARAVGADGAVGDAETLSVWVDAEPPQVAFAVSTVRTQRNGERVVDVTVEAQDDVAVAHIETSVDGGAFRRYAEEPLTLPAGEAHDVAIRAWDVAGNASGLRTVRLEAVEQGAGARSW